MSACVIKFKKLVFLNKTKCFNFFLNYFKNSEKVWQGRWRIYLKQYLWSLSIKIPRVESDKVHNLVSTTFRLFYLTFTYNIYKKCLLNVKYFVWMANTYHFTPSDQIGK